MQGVHAFYEFCRDEMWDVPAREFDNGVFLELSWNDPRYDRFYHFLANVMHDAGIRRIESLRHGLVVIFDECGAQTPSMVFLVKSTFQNSAHVEAARRRDRKERKEFLEAHAAIGVPFTKHLVHPAIRLLQHSLNEHGFDVLEDGRWGWKTRLQLWRFRRRHHLATSKSIDYDTLDALEV